MEDNFKKITGYNWTTKDITIQNLNKERSYTKINSRPSSFYLKQHLSDKMILVLSQFPNSNILKIDIDQRSNTVDTSIIIDKLAEKFGYSCILEYSPISKGYHVFFKTNKPLHDNQKKQIEKYFKEQYNFIIEVKKTNENLKLPFSIYYPIFGVYDSNESNRIFTTITKNNEYHHILNTITSMFQHQKKIDIPIDIIKDNILPPKLTNKRIINLQAYNEYKKLQKELSESELQLKFGYGRGTRYNTQYKIAKYCIEKEKSFSQFKYLCEICNIRNSKDMANPLRKDKVILEAWEYGKKIANKNYNIFIESRDAPEEYICQNYTLTKDEKYKLEYILRVHIRKYKVYKYSKNIERVVKDCIKVYQEIVGRSKFDKKHNRVYENENFKCLTNKTAMAKSTFQKMAKALQIKNMRLIKKILIKSSLIIEGKNKENKTYGYKKLRWCKHFSITDINELFKFYINNIYILDNKFNNILKSFKNQKKTLIYVIKFLRLKDKEYRKEYTNQKKKQWE